MIALLIAGVFLVDLPLPAGVLGHEGSAVIVVLNGLLNLLALPGLRRQANLRAELRMLPLGKESPQLEALVFPR